MINVSKLIYDEIMLYEENLNYEIISDLDLFYADNYVLKNILISSNRFLLDDYNNHNINNTIDNTLIQKCNIDSRIVCKHTCIICLENISNGDAVYNLKCGTKEQPHIYHKICFEKWNKPNCPYCRTELMHS